MAKVPKGESHEQTDADGGDDCRSESKKPFVVSEEDKQFLIELFEPAQLVHKKTIDKHKTLPVPAGKYKVIYKTEYNPFEQVIQRVQD